MTNANAARLANYAERLRLLHNTVRPLLPAAQQDELLELAVGVALLVPPEDEPASLCDCGHPKGRHRTDPIVCLDCWHTPSPTDSTRHEHGFQQHQGQHPGPMPVP